MRSEAVKPPAAYPGVPHGMEGQRPGGPAMMDPRQQGYPPEMGSSAFANPMMGGYGYGAMDFYGAYGGYPGMYAAYPPMGGSPESMARYGQYPPMDPYAQQGYPMDPYAQGYPPMDPYSAYGQQPGGGYPPGGWGGQ